MAHLKGLACKTRLYSTESPAAPLAPAPRRGGCRASSELRGVVGADRTRRDVGAFGPREL